MESTVAGDLSRMLSTNQAARRLEVSAARVLQLVEAGELPALRTPLGTLVDPKDVEQLRQWRAKRKIQQAQRA